jgi:hypothetical protein
MAVIAALPAVGVQFWNEYDLRRARTQELEEQVLRLARLQSAEIDRLAEGARQFLVALAQIPQINSQDASACASLLARIRENYRAAYRAIIVADADGTVVCSSVGPGPGVAGQAYFRLAIQSNDFAVGNYVEDRATRAPGIHFAYPLHTQTGTISGVVAAALDLDWFAERLREKLPPNASLTVGDRAGTIVVRLPDNEARRGQPIPDEFRARLHSSAPAVTRSLGPDGIMRIVGYVPISVSENGMYVSIAREWEPAFADLNRSARRGTLIIAASFVFSLLLAWAWSEAGIRRPINRLLAVVESWRGGRFTRADHEWGRSELGRLGRAFDELAQTLGDASRSWWKARTGSGTASVTSHSSSIACPPASCRPAPREPTCSSTMPFASWSAAPATISWVDRFPRSLIPTTPPWIVRATPRRSNAGGTIPTARDMSVPTGPRSGRRTRSTCWMTPIKASSRFPWS